MYRSMIYYLICATIYRMQHHDVSKTPERFKTAFLDPLKIAQDTFTYKPTTEEKAKLSAQELLSKKKTREDEKKTEVIDYITRVFLISQDKKIDMCSLLFCVSSISSINLKSLFGSLLDKEPNVTLYAVTTTCAYIFTSRMEECWCWTRPIFKSPDTKNSPT